MHRLTSRIVADEDALRAIIGHPTALVASKVVHHLTPATRRYVKLAPLVVLATSDGAGGCDASPRGDPAGFVRILDDRTLLLPERPGNRIADSLKNILVNPHAALWFLIPGVAESLRVDGRATLTDDPELLAPSAVEGKAPRLGILVDIDHAYTQCGKAVLRSGLWDPVRFRTAADLPTSGEMFACLHEGFDAAAYDEERAARYARREGFY